MGSKTATSETTATWLQRLQPYCRRAALWGVVAALGVTAVGLGVLRLQRQVEQRYAHTGLPPRVVFREQPAWMNEALATRLLSIAQPVAASSVFDPAVLRDIHTRLLSDPFSRRWVREVRAVRRVYGFQPGDTIEIDAAFRTPAAVVRRAGAFYLVDGEGVLLEDIAPEQVTRVLLAPDGRLVLRVIDGVTRPPPEPGQSVPADLSAGLALAKLLHDRTFARDIVKVDVSNFNGRQDPTAAHLRLVTRHGTEIRWGRPLGTPHNFGEVDDARKLLYLDRIHAEFGRPDARRPWVDLRFDRPLWPRLDDTPADATPPNTAATGAAGTAGQPPLELTAVSAAR
ncbi:MAG: hypothetical protein ACK4PI_10175 [Tepidisphaerales bacterium]